MRRRIELPYTLVGSVFPLCLAQIQHRFTLNNCEAEVAKRADPLLSLSKLKGKENDPPIKRATTQHWRAGP
jgi:hypothetical protein